MEAHVQTEVEIFSIETLSVELRVMRSCDLDVPGVPVVLGLIGDALGDVGLDGGDIVTSGTLSSCSKET